MTGFGQVGCWGSPAPRLRSVLTRPRGFCAWPPASLAVMMRTSLTVCLCLGDECDSPPSPPRAADPFPACPSRCLATEPYSHPRSPLLPPRPRLLPRRRAPAPRPCCRLAPRPRRSRRPARGRPPPRRRSQRRPRCLSPRHRQSRPPRRNLGPCRRLSRKRRLQAHRWCVAAAAGRCVRVEAHPAGERAVGRGACDTHRVLGLAKAELLDCSVERQRG